MLCSSLPEFQFANNCRQSKLTMPPKSAIPDFYYFFFGAYEPFLTIIGFLGALVDPLSAHNSQAPWSTDALPYQTLPTATLVTILQLAHVCALLGCINVFVFSAVRKHVPNNPALQEKIVSSLMTPLLIGDLFHMWLTFWALGDQRWNFRSWSPMLWTTVILGFSLMIPRICWHLGIGRYVDSRDGSFREGYTPASRESFKS